jgi:predicted RecA/RadA family phage recombinase
MKGFDPATGLGFVQNGRYVEIVLPYDRASGEGVLVGTLFGVCVKGGKLGEADNIDTDGVYGLVAATGASTDAVFGVAAYWDNTAKKVTPVATNNTLIGKFLAAKTTTQAFATVRLS